MEMRFRGVERGVCHYDNDKEVIFFFYEGSIEPGKVKEYFRNYEIGRASCRERV